MNQKIFHSLEIEERKREGQSPEKKIIQNWHFQQYDESKFVGANIVGQRPECRQSSQ